MALQQVEYNEFIKKRLKKTEDLLRTKQLQINSLLEITRAINSNMPGEAIFRIYEFILRAQLNIHKLALFAKDKEWRCVCFNGVEQDVIDGIQAEELLSYAQSKYLDKEDHDSLQSFELIIPVWHKDTPLAFTLVGDITMESDIDSQEEKLKFVQTITNIVIVAIENKKLFKKQVQQQMMEKEMELAAQMQAMLIPSNLPNNDIMDIAAVYLPHRDIGGDYYDFIELNENEFVISISDISGKGVPAGLLMANFQATLRTLINKEYPLEQLVDLLNFKVSEITKGEKYITFFIAVYNSESRMLRYINAGHNPSYLINNGELITLDKGCTILGMFDALPFVNVGEEYLDDEAVLINYTDGLLDLENGEQEMYESDRLEAFIRKNQLLGMTEFNDTLLDEIKAFRGEEGQFVDDISILSCRFH